MPSFWTPIKVGIVVAAGVAAFGLGLYFIGSTGVSKSKSYLVYAIFDDATGLGVRSRVQIAGIPIGQVDRIELDQTTAKARVWLRINRTYVLHKDASITKRSESILGDFLLDVFPGNPQTGNLADGDELKNVLKQPGMGEVFNQLSKIAGDISDVTANLRKVLGSQEGEDNLRAIIAGLARLTKSLERTVDTASGKLNATLDNFQGFSGDLRQITSGEKGDVVEILKNTRDATAEARDILKTVGGIIGSQNQGDLKESVKGIKGSLDKLDAALANVRDISDKINKGQGTIGKLVNDDKLIKNLDRASSSISDLLGQASSLKIEVNERSEFLIGVPNPSANIFTNAQTTAYDPWTKNYFGLRIIPKPDKWYGFDLIDDPRGLVTRTKIQNCLPTDKNCPNQTPALTNPFYPPTVTQITTSRQLKFSGYLGKRYGVVSGRVGILENTGGFGLKVHLFNDSLTLSADAFEFANPLKDHPRVKLYADYRFLDHLLITAGADDLVNQRVQDPDVPSRVISGRDYFIGAGVYFTDDDLKLILAALPIKP